LFVGDQVPDIDRGRLLSIALLHDMAEALFGDLPVGARRYFGIEAKHEAERLAMQELLSEVPNAAEYLELWDDYAARASREARLVKQLDRLEMLAQAAAYERAGNRNMDEFWQDFDEGWSEEFPIIQELADELRMQIIRRNV
ncbi:MAG: HD domain-containing protein, partial [Chloroflexaceae bacterium]|nr:HD domain-containing protein [Chloroflexaceae bacterium]